MECNRCGSTKDIHKHHKRHRIDGGGDDYFLHMGFQVNGSKFSVGSRWVDSGREGLVAKIANHFGDELSLFDAEKESVGDEKENRCDGCSFSILGRRSDSANRRLDRADHAASRHA